jgi:hypothetical protein
MSRSLAALLLALVGGCSPAPTLAPAPTAAQSASAATLSIAGSGGPFCGPWWYGCGAYLAIEAPGWTFPRDWAPSDGDTRFTVVPDISEKEPTKVTGVMQLGQERIEPGTYRLAVIETHTSDTSSNGDPPRFDAFLLCTKDALIPEGTVSVGVEVSFSANRGCAVTVSFQPGPAPEGS